jgi:hypothetical protein
VSTETVAPEQTPLRRPLTVFLLSHCRKGQRTCPEQSLYYLAEVPCKAGRCFVLKRQYKSQRKATHTQKKIVKNENDHHVWGLVPMNVVEILYISI